jgi:Bacterial Ig-like domain
MAPTGGPADKIAPKLVSRTLPDSTLNFKGGKATFNFDERVDDASLNIETFPLMPNKPKVVAAKKGFTIVIDDSLLQPNTTYKVSMGNSIKDIYEGTAVENFKFTFCTGNVFDTLQLSGTVKIAETGMADTAAWVLLYPNIKSDTDITFLKPLYAIKPDASGFFNITNLPNKEYYIYAVADKNNNYVFDMSTERIAFFNTTVLPSKDGKPSINLSTFFDKTDTSNKQNIATIFNRSTNRFAINIDTLDIKKRTYDITQPIKISFANKIKNFDKTKIRLYTDNILDETGLISFDSINNNIKLNIEFNKDAIYKLELLKGFATDTSELLGNVFNFRTKKETDYGSLKIKFMRELPNYNTVAQLFLNGNIISKQIIKNNVLQFAMLNPGNYILKFMHDINNNGMWDNGTYKNGKRQPEILEILPQDIIIKANWLNEVEVK